MAKEKRDIKVKSKKAKTPRYSESSGRSRSSSRSRSSPRARKTARQSKKNKRQSSRSFSRSSSVRRPSRSSSDSGRSRKQEKLVRDKATKTTKAMAKHERDKAQKSKRNQEESKSHRRRKEIKNHRKTSSSSYRDSHDRQDSSSDRRERKGKSKKDKNKNRNKSKSRSRRKAKRSSRSFSRSKSRSESSNSRGLRSRSDRKAKRRNSSSSKGNDKSEKSSQSESEEYSDDFKMEGTIVFSDNKKTKSNIPKYSVLKDLNRDIRNIDYLLLMNKFLATFEATHGENFYYLEHSLVDEKYVIKMYTELISEFTEIPELSSITDEAIRKVTNKSLEDPLSYNCIISHIAEEKKIKYIGFKFTDSFLSRKHNEKYKNMYNDKYLQDAEDQVNKLIKKEVRKAHDPIKNNIKIDQSTTPNSYFKKIKKLVEKVDKNALYNTKNSRFELKTLNSQISEVLSDLKTELCCYSKLNPQDEADELLTNQIFGHLRYIKDGDLFSIPAFLCLKHDSVLVDNHQRDGTFKLISSQSAISQLQSQIIEQMKNIESQCKEEVKFEILYQSISEEVADKVKQLNKLQTTY